MANKKLYIKALLNGLEIEENLIDKLNLDSFEPSDNESKKLTRAQKWATNGQMTESAEPNKLPLVKLPLVFDIAKIEDRKKNKQKTRYYADSKLDLNTGHKVDEEWNFGNAKSNNASLFVETGDEASTEDLKKAFQAELNSLEFGENDFQNAFTLQHLIQKYYWNVGVGESKKLVSRYEYNRLTAAFAYCLSFENPVNEQTPLQVVSVDLGGIQRFIYDISSSKAAKSLKGRSFYVQALLNSVAKSLLEKTEGFWGQMIYSAGGKFHVLLPFTENINKDIEEFKEKLEIELWKKHREKLQLNIGSCAFGYDKTEKLILKPSLSKDEDALVEAKEGLKDLWKALADSVERSKFQAFQSVIKAEIKLKPPKGLDLDKGLPWANLFKPNPIPKDAKPCEVTGELVEESNLVKLDENEKKDETAQVLPFVREQAKLGKQLTEASSILYNKEQSLETFKIDEDPEEIDLLNSDGDIKVEKGLWQSMNNTSMKALKKQTGEFGLGYTFYGGNLSPMTKIGKEAKESTFEEIVGNIDGEFNRLGVLRMDVDNLGALFQEGFDEETRHFAAYSTLSFRLDLFFSGFINTLRNSTTYKDRIKIIYSGGDDVFAVGRWDKCISFAHDLNEAFKVYVGENPITLSAGVAIVRPKFPIAKAAELAREEEEKAKEHKFPKEAKEEKTKNSISFFGMPLSWKEEFPFVLDIKKALVKAISPQQDNTKALPHALLRHLMEWGEKAREDKKDRKKEDKINRKEEDKPDRKKEDISWRWMSAYQLGRMAQDYKVERPNENGKTKKVAHPLLERLKKILFAEEDPEVKANFKEVFKHTSYKPPQLLAMAARWAELELRTKENKT